MPPPPPPAPDAVVTSTRVIPGGVEMGATDACTAGNAEVAWPAASPATAKLRLRRRLSVPMVSPTLSLTSRYDFGECAVRLVGSCTETGDRNAYGLFGCLAVVCFCCLLYISVAV